MATGAFFIAFPSCLCYIFNLTIEQTVEIPANHRLVIDVPREVPAGRAVITFTPVVDQRSDKVSEDGLCPDGECPICAAKNYIPNAETIAAIEEGRAMLRGEIPAKWHTSLDDLDKILGL